MFLLLEQNLELARRQRAHDRARQAAPVAHRRGVPPEPAPPSAVPRHPARAARRHAHAEAHEHVRRARAVHSGVRPRRRPHAVRLVPRVHGRRAHAVRRRESAALRAAAFRRRVPVVQRRHAATREARSRVSRRAVSRHRQGPRRRPLGARLRRRGSVLPRARHEPLRRAPRRLARAESLAAVADGAEEGLERSRASSTSSRAPSAIRRTSIISTC